MELTPQQYELLCQQSKQCGLSKRGFLVRLIEGKPVKARPSQEIKALRTEIHHIGNNINQIAKRLNESGRAYDTDLAEILEKQKQLWGLANKILMKLSTIQ